MRSAHGARLRSRRPRGTFGVVTWSSGQPSFELPVPRWSMKTRSRSTFTRRQRRDDVRCVVGDARAAPPREPEQRVPLRVATGGAEDGHVELDLSAAGVARILAYSKPLALRRPLADRAGLETRRRAEARSDHERERNRRHQEHTRGSDDARRACSTDHPTTSLQPSDNPLRLNAHRKRTTANGDGHPESNATWARQSRNFAFGNPANPSTPSRRGPWDSRLVHSRSATTAPCTHSLLRAKQECKSGRPRPSATGHGLTFGRKRGALTIALWECLGRNGRAAPRKGALNDPRSRYLVQVVAGRCSAPACRPPRRDSRLGGDRGSALEAVVTAQLRAAVRRSASGQLRDRVPRGKPGACGGTRV